jgi:hypothetical protein
MHRLFASHVLKKKTSKDNAATQIQIQTNQAFTLITRLKQMSNHYWLVLQGISSLNSLSAANRYC